MESNKTKMACYIEPELAVRRGTEVQILSSIVRALQDGFALESRDLPVSHTQIVHHLKMMQKEAPDDRHWGYEAQKREVARLLLAFINEYFRFPIENLSMDALNKLMPGVQPTFCFGVAETEKDLSQIRQQLHSYLNYLNSKNEAFKKRLEAENDPDMELTMNKIYRAEALSEQMWMEKQKIVDKKKDVFKADILQELRGEVGERQEAVPAEAIMLRDHEEVRDPARNDDDDGNETDSQQPEGAVGSVGD